MRIHFVSGNHILTGSNAAFDMPMVRLARVSLDLFRVNDCVSDVIVLKFCSSDTIEKLLKLIETGGEDPLDIAFMSMLLYFIRTFVHVFNGDYISFEAKMTMLWTPLMLLSLLNGIDEKLLNNFSSPYVGGIILRIQ